MLFVLRVSLSLSPAPVAHSDMVPPTWHRPGDWAAGRTEHHLRHRTTLVLTHQKVYERQTDRLRYANAWHFFPEEQPPSRHRQPRLLNSLDLLVFSLPIAPCVARSATAYAVIQIVNDDTVHCRFRPSERSRCSLDLRFACAYPPLSKHCLPLVTRDPPDCFLS